MTDCPFLNFTFSGFWDKFPKLILESLLLRLERGSGFGGFVDTNHDGGNDDGDNDDGGDSIVCTAARLNLQTNFQKGRLDRISVFRRGLLGKRGSSFLGGLLMLHENKLKSEIMTKKVYKQKCVSLS